MKKRNLLVTIETAKVKGKTIIGVYDIDNETSLLLTDSYPTYSNQGVEKEVFQRLFDSKKINENFIENGVFKQKEVESKFSVTFVKSKGCFLSKI